MATTNVEIILFIGEWFVFQDLAEQWSDGALGALLLVLSLIILCVCLVCIVKILHYVLKGKVAVIIRKYMNADFPGVMKYFTGYVAILIGAGVTILVQSSSIFTSSITPLVGIGVISIDRMYPLTLGSNIGTTATGVLAALSQSSDKLEDSMQIALCHLFFNIVGILIFYPIPFMRFPIGFAKFLGNETAKYRWFALMYLIVMFFIVPLCIFGLSLVGWRALTGVMVPIVFLLCVIGLINFCQRTAALRKHLPMKLRDWKFLPLPLRSLKPLDNIFKNVFSCCKCIHHGDHHKDHHKETNHSDSTNALSHHSVKM